MRDLPDRWRDLGGGWNVLFNVVVGTGHVNPPRRGTAPVRVSVDGSGRVRFGRGVPGFVEEGVRRWIAAGAPPDAG